MQMIDKKKIRRCLRAIDIAKILFEYEGYHTRYLENLENSLKELLKDKSLKQGGKHEIENYGNYKIRTPQ